MIIYIYIRYFKVSLLKRHKKNVILENDNIFISHMEILNHYLDYVKCK